MSDQVPIDRYRAAFEHAFDAIAIADGEGRYIDVNESMAALVGLPREEVIGRHIADFAPEDYDFKGAWEQFQHSDSERDIFPLISVDGERRQVEYSATPNIVEGEHLSIMRDVTDRERQRSIITEQRDGLELLNQLVRHDIRNDLTILNGYLDLLEDVIEDEEGQAYLSKASASLENAISVTEQTRVMAQSMIQSDAPLEPVDLESLLERQCGNIEAAYPNVTVRLNGTSESVTILADELIGSLFDNILTNAVIHNDEDEPVIDVDLTMVDDSVTVHIADNGPGISDSRKEALFESHSKDDSENTTLGLYLVKTLVDRYDGSIWVEDNEPKGSIFSVTFPRNVG